jgi:hypothetical protein
MGELTDRVTGEANAKGRQTQNSEWFDYLIRGGFVAYGIVHLTIAWLAIQLALGNSSGKKTNNKGAMHELAQQPFGKVLLWVIVVGMAALVLWKLLDAIYGHGEKDEDAKKWAKKANSIGKAIVYGFVSYSALQVAVGAGSNSKGRSTTAKLMDAPAGQLLVGLVGLAIVGYGGYMAYRGLTEKYKEHLTAEGKSGEAGKAYIMFGKVGYVAKGVSIIIVGGLFVYAAISHKAKKSGGLDDALHTVQQQAYGPVLLFVIALGIACYGLFCFARARYLSRSQG